MRRKFRSRLTLRSERRRNSQVVRNALRLTRRLLFSFEVLERRDLLVSDWQNPLLSIDVTDDGFVSPIDALFVINDINTNSARPITSPYTDEPTSARYVDVNGDQFLSAIDALLVINWLNTPQVVRPMTVALVSDSGDSSTDRITNNANLRAQVEAMLIKSSKLLSRYSLWQVACEALIPCMLAAALRGAFSQFSFLSIRVRLRLWFSRTRGVSPLHLSS